MAMGNSLSPIVSNIFMEHFEKLALDSAPYKPSLWLRFVDDIFVVWPYGPERLYNFLGHLNSLRPSIPPSQFHACACFRKIFIAFFPVRSLDSTWSQVFI
jgi:hypothetical protein